jgi:hypothetical protein
MKFKKALKRFLITTSIITLIWGIGYLSTGIRNRVVLKDSPVYSSKRELKKDFEKRLASAGLDHLVVDVDIVKKPLEKKLGIIGVAGDFKKTGPNSYYVWIDDDYMKREVVGHEIGHIHLRERTKLHFIWNLPFFDIYDEWNATSYAIEDPQ